MTAPDLALSQRRLIRRLVATPRRDGRAEAAGTLRASSSRPRRSRLIRRPTRFSSGGAAAGNSSDAACPASPGGALGVGSPVGVGESAAPGFALAEESGVWATLEGLSARAVAGVQTSAASGPEGRLVGDRSMNRAIEE
jgi:hypothetical protein